MRNSSETVSEGTKKSKTRHISSAYVQKIIQIKEGINESEDRRLNALIEYYNGETLDHICDKYDLRLKSFYTFKNTLESMNVDESIQWMKKIRAKKSSTKKVEEKSDIYKQISEIEAKMNEDLAAINKILYA